MHTAHGDKAGSRETRDGLERARGITSSLWVKSELIDFSNMSKVLKFSQQLYRKAHLSEEETDAER
jgi:hypothetical protein